ncbi:MAG: ABC transporter substrate-binding protein [Burkholderiales bacterium]
MTQRRRRLVALAGGIMAALLPLVAAAQPAPKVWRVGVLRPGPAPLSPADTQVVSLPKALRELGYEEGRNLVIERRYADADVARLPDLARELVQTRADVIVAVGAAATRAARAASGSVPIVMFGNFDPLALGLVSNLAQPGGNLTGVLIAPDGTLAGKRLELLKSAVPTVSRIALLAPADEPAFGQQLQETHKAAAALGVRLTVAEVRGGDYVRAFAALAADKPGALLVGAHTYFVRDRQQIIALATQHRLPSMWEWREQAQDGGLMSYSTSLYGLNQRIASHIDRIFKGTKPGDIPIEQPTRFELVVNLKTAKALGVAISPALRLQADEVIE